MFLGDVLKEFIFDCRLRVSLSYHNHSKDGAAILTMITKEETDAYNLRETLYDNIYAPYHLKKERQWAVWYCDELSDEMEYEIKKRI